MTQEAKQRFLGFLLGELAKLVQIEEAKVATLAGVGLEAELWAKHGIQPDNGWLVDSNPKAIRKLINKNVDMPWRLYRGQAHSFPAILKSTYGEEAALDLFHLDLYGTVEKALFEAGSLIPIVAKSRARMFALTVSDQRGHFATMRPGALWQFMTEILGPAACGVLRTVDWAHFSVIEAQRSKSDPYASVRRECATVLSWFCAPLIPDGHYSDISSDVYPALTEIVRKAGRELPLMYPVKKMQRMVYADGYRMKSYVFELGAEQVPFNDALFSLAEAWMQAPFHFINDAGALDWRGINHEVDRDHDGRHFAKTFSAVFAASRLQELLPVLSPEKAEDLETVLRYFKADKT